MKNTKKLILAVIIGIFALVVVAVVAVSVFVFIDRKSNENLKDLIQQEIHEEIYEEVYEDSQITTMYIANVENSVYFRSAPYENDSNIITTIPVGEQVVWIENETPVFSKISYNGQTGYVKRDYLSTKKPTSKTPPVNTTVSKYMYVANVENSIYLRSSASENSSNIITTIPVGTRVGFIETVSNVFSRINYDGKIGYVKTKYLLDYYNTGYEYLTVSNVKKSIYLRSTPYENSNNIICEIPLHSVVRFISDASGGFYKISWDGHVGYSKAIYLK